ncbi:MULTISPECIES: hypothetical protein [unclassified Leucobacter]|uniref:hypothetical protein n=1 Tax=unclassified Leucobacter TaxID=2621730 RepID=UPI003016170C
MSGVAGSGPEAVSYDGLPAASGGAHGMRIARVDRAMAAVDAFVDACLEPSGDPRWTFQVLGRPAASGGAYEQALREALGGPARTEAARRVWRVPAERAAEAAALLDPKLPGALRAPTGQRASLVRTLSGRLTDPATGRPDPELDPARFGEDPIDGYGRRLGVSGVRASFGTAGSKLSLWLTLPADERLVPAARHLQEHLPFRLSAKQWRRWVPLRSGAGYRSTRIADPLA